MNINSDACGCRCDACPGCALALALSAGCGGPDKPIAATIVPTAAGRQPWTHLNFDNDPDNFQFAIVGDRTGRHRPGVFENGIAKLNLLRPEFVMSRRRLDRGVHEGRSARSTSSGTRSNRSPPSSTRRSSTCRATTTCPTRSRSRSGRDRFGPAYYHFVYRDVLFLALNTYDPESRISSEQIAYVARALKENPKVRHTCVFMHEPLWDYKNRETGWGEVEKLLLDRPYTVFAGHYHTYTKYVRNDRRYFVLATTGGGLKKGLASPELGAFDHVTWVTMRPDGPRVANIELDAIHDENVRTEAAANLINRVLNGNALEISPVLMAGEAFDARRRRSRFGTTRRSPMSVRGTIASSRHAAGGAGSSSK